MDCLKSKLSVCLGAVKNCVLSSGLQRALRVLVAQLERLAPKRKKLLQAALKEWTVRRYRVRNRSLVGAEEFIPFEHDSDHGVQNLPGPRNTLLPRCGGPTCSKGASVGRDLPTVQGGNENDSNPKKRQSFYICLHTLRPFRRRRVGSF
jgi:hypothetical protein